MIRPFLDHLQITRMQLSCRLKLSSIHVGVVFGSVKFNTSDFKFIVTNWYVYITCNMVRTSAAFVTGFYNVPEKVLSWKIINSSSRLYCYYNDTTYTQTLWWRWQHNTFYETCLTNVTYTLYVSLLRLLTK